MILLTPDSHVVRHDLAGTFAGLMDLYERNYIGLRRLLPELPPAGSERASRVAAGLPLYLRVDDRFRYTTELTLTYRFRRAKRVHAEPNLRVRIYHDARQAEVMAAALRTWPGFQAGRNTELAMRWRVNRFLYKWLNFCLHQGHRFDPEP